MSRYKLNCTEKTLSNGMHVILVHKPDYNRSLFMLSTQAGGFDLKQRVAGNVKVHPSGCAHFLEHQMFRLNGQDVTDEFAAMGAQTNAFTSFTKTAYFFQTTSEPYRPLSLLMDFVQTLDIDYDSVEKEKGIILSEYDMYQHSPEHRLLKSTWESMYVSHPMKVDILGTRQDISQMTVQQLQTFYDLNYDSSRLTLVGITGRDIEQTMKVIEQAQKKIASKHPEKVETIFGEHTDKVWRTEFEDQMDISTPYVCVGYKLSSVQDKKQCIQTDVAIQMRLDSLFSPLNEQYNTWMEQEIITPVMGAECDFSEDHGYLLFYAQTHHPEKFVELVQSLIDQLQNEIMDQDTFEALHNRLIAQNIRGIDNFENLAVDLLEARQNGFQLMQAFEWTDKLTLEDVTSICHDLDLSHHTITTIRPKSSKS